MGTVAKRPPCQACGTTTHSLRCALNLKLALKDLFLVIAKSGHGPNMTFMQNADLAAYQTYFDADLSKALERFQERVGEPLDTPVKITCVEENAFWALAIPLASRLQLDVPWGALARIRHVWEKVLDVSSTLPKEQQVALLGSKDHAIETSFSWLLQHELNHHAIGHFKLTDGAALSEGKSPQGLGIVQRSSQKKSKLDILTEDERNEMHFCLELQTDHDATEIVLGAYATENWTLFRYYATCILVVIFIIEAEERSSTERNRKHPYAATRLFMLIAHLVELPMIPGIKRAHTEGLKHLPENYLPSSEELVAYRSEVVKPVMTASQVIAQACSIPEAWTELGSAEAFFEDIDAIIIEGANEVQQFSTLGAKQWAELKPLNDKYLKMLRR